MLLIILILAALTCLIMLRSGKGNALADTGLIQDGFQQVPVPEEHPGKGLSPEEKGYYRIVHNTKRTPRKTYLFGALRGKYCGEAAKDTRAGNDDQFLYDMHIYEAEVLLETSDTCSCITPYKCLCIGLHKEHEGRFEGQDETAFPRQKLPGQLPVIVKKEGQEYAVTLYEPQLARVRLISRLHRTDGQEVQGTLEAYITGILLDFTDVEYTTQLYFKDISAANIAPLPAVPPFPLIKMDGPADFLPPAGSGIFS